MVLAVLDSEDREGLAGPEVLEVHRESWLLSLIKTTMDGSTRKKEMKLASKPSRAAQVALAAVVDLVDLADLVEDVDLVDLVDRDRPRSLA